MKRFLFSVLVFLFGVLVVLVSVWRSRPPVVTHAAETNSATQEATPVMQEVVVQEDRDYSLPYPGILPDHPLYFLKMFRDRIRLWLTRDSLSRAQLMLQYADKRVASSLALAEKGKAGLAGTTATKAEIYFEQALDEAQRASEGGSDTGSFYETYLRSSKKHEEVLLGVLSRAPDEAKTAVQQAMEQSKRAQQRSMEISGLRIDELEGIVEDEQVGDVEDDRGSFKSEATGESVETDKNGQDLNDE